MKLGQRQIKMLTLIIFSSSLFYYVNNLIFVGGDFSDGILVGFLLGLILVSSFYVCYLFLEMVYLNFKVRFKWKE